MTFIVHRPGPNLRRVILEAAEAAKQKAKIKKKRRPRPSQPPPRSRAREILASEADDSSAVVSAKIATMTPGQAPTEACAIVASLIVCQATASAGAKQNTLVETQSLSEAKSASRSLRTEIDCPIGLK